MDNEINKIFYFILLSSVPVYHLIIFKVCPCSSGILIRNLKCRIATDWTYIGICRKHQKDEILKLDTCRTSQLNRLQNCHKAKLKKKATKEFFRHRQLGPGTKNDIIK